MHYITEAERDDARRDRDEEYEAPCPDCGSYDVTLTDIIPANRTQPESGAARCQRCGYEWDW